jgi:hypothetical protein
MMPREDAGVYTTSSHSKWVPLVLRLSAKSTVSRRAQVSAAVGGSVLKSRP